MTPACPLPRIATHGPHIDEVIVSSPRSTTPAAGRAFSAIRLNERPGKPRHAGITEIRGPYYTPMGPHYLEDILDTMGTYIDALKFAGGSFSLMPRDSVARLIELCHAHEVVVSTGGFIEYVLGQGPEAVDAYLREARDLGFDIIELSSGFITLPFADWLRLVEKVKAAGFTAKPEIGIQFGAGGASAQAELEAEGTRDPEWLVRQGRRFLDAGADLLMIESEGITENVRTWRTDVIARIADSLGLEHVMFEAADPAVFTWYIKNYGSEVNLFVDHSQIVQLECLRSGIWGTKDVWGRIKTFKE
jgi:phosphosulfolactate synthase (CoM biosynthesis protein A)